MQKELETHCPKCQHEFVSVVELEEPVVEVSEDRLAEIEAPLQDRITELEEEKARLQEKADLFNRLAKRLKTPDGFVELAVDWGYEAFIPKPSEDELAAVREADKDEDTGEHEIEVEPKPETKVDVEPEPSPEFIQGKTDKEGYKYLPNLDISVKRS